MSHHFNDYVVNVRVDSYAVHGTTFQVNIFLGPVPPDPSTWGTADTLVGVVTNLGGGRRGPGRFGGNADGPDGESPLTGQVSLTNPLLDLIESGAPVNGLRLKSLDREDVEPFLVRNLHWRVSTIGPSEVPLEQVPSLKVSVAVCRATIPEDPFDLIQYGEYEILARPTRGRLGGFDPSRDRL